MDRISDVEAQENFGALLDQVEQGRELVITRGGKPVARLVGAVDGSATSFAEDVEALRSSMRARGALSTLEEIIEFRNEGRR